MTRLPNARRLSVRLVAWTIAPVAATLLLGARPRAQQAVRAPARVETALDRYVAAPDPIFSWKLVQQTQAAGATVSLLDMTSQQWLTDRDVDHPLWTHSIAIIRPAAVKSDVGLLVISGGSNQRQAPAPARWLLDLANDTGTVIAELRLVPNQPIVFLDDPERKPRTEDDFIAYTWEKYLRTGDERWPARLPMTKSAVRAMDAVTAFAASNEGGGVRVDQFVVAGASKRGWTTWTTAAVDRRVVAIAPMVIDLLNIEPSFIHHWQAYGAWSEAVHDYVERRIMDWLGTPQFRALMRIEEPYEYRDRLTMPKFIVNASGDQFFVPDSSQFYFGDLPGEKSLRYVPNASHTLADSDATDSVSAFYSEIVTKRARPVVTSTFEADGSIKVLSKDLPTEVRLWQATNPKARNFRLDVIGPAYQSTVLRPSGPNTWVGRVTAPAAGWTAFFVELTFPSGGKYPLKVTSAIRIVPDALPYPPPARQAVGEPIARGGGR
jgi:PhoPQ-activated pathogenicity-related protein